MAFSVLFLALTHQQIQGHMGHMNRSVTSENWASWLDSRRWKILSKSQIKIKEEKYSKHVRHPMKVNKQKRTYFRRTRVRDNDGLCASHPSVETPANHNYFVKKWKECRFYLLKNCHLNGIVCLQHTRLNRNPQHSIQLDSCLCFPVFNTHRPIIILCVPKTNFDPLNLQN